MTQGEWVFCDRCDGDGLQSADDAFFALFYGVSDRCGTCKGAGLYFKAVSPEELEMMDAIYALRLSISYGFVVIKPQAGLIVGTTF